MEERIDCNCKPCPADCNEGSVRVANEDGDFELCSVCKGEGYIQCFDCFCEANNITSRYQLEGN